MGWESFGVIGFDLWPLFQGQMRIAKINSVYILLIRIPRGFAVSHQHIGNGQISPWASPSRLSNVRMALVSFISGGYNLHRFSDAIGLV